jgi:hypothetical protein
MSFVAQKVGRLLNEEEKKKAILLLAEMKSRGMEIPDGLEVPESTT